MGKNQKQSKNFLAQYFGGLNQEEMNIIVWSMETIRPEVKRTIILKISSKSIYNYKFWQSLKDFKRNHCFISELEKGQNWFWTEQITCETIFGFFNFESFRGLNK